MLSLCIVICTYIVHFLFIYLVICYFFNCISKYHEIFFRLLNMNKCARLSTWYGDGYSESERKRHFCMTYIFALPLTVWPPFV